MSFRELLLLFFDRRGAISVNQPRGKTFPFKAKAGRSLQSDFRFDCVEVSRVRVLVNQDSAGVVFSDCLNVWMMLAY